MVWIVVAVVLAIVVFVISLYNKLVTLRNRYKNAFAQIDVQLKRRYDLIPNLVETAKAFMQHEKETLEAVIQARNIAVNANQQVHGDATQAEAMRQLLGAEGQLSATLGRLFALSENYPDLKSNANMMQLSEEIASTENKIAFARQAFNDAVTQYNISREVFPSSIVANSFNFSKAQLFEINLPAERQAVKVSF